MGFTLITLLLAGISFISGIIALVYFAFLLFEDDKKSGTIVTLISIVLCIASLFTLIKMDEHFEKMPYEYSDKPYSIEYITALQDNSEVNGKFSGGRHYIRGYINEKSYYSYMVKLNNGGMIANKVPSDSTTIYEINDSFRVEWWVKSKKWLGYKEEVEYWKIYIPSGSVINDYNIDLQ